MGSERWRLSVCLPVDTLVQAAERLLPEPDGDSKKGTLVMAAIMSSTSLMVLTSRGLP